MKKRPIMFSGPMVRAILDGRKTQTRRVVKPQPIQAYTVARVELSPPLPDGTTCELWWNGIASHDGLVPPCPFGQPGDRLWVKETWQYEPTTGAPSYEEVRDSPDFFGWRPPNHGLYYQASEDEAGVASMRWRSPRFMPHWASRLTLEVTGVRVERLQEISEADATAEGRSLSPGHQHGFFPATWNSLNAKRGFGWEANPWVWVIEFRRVGEFPA